MMESGGAPATAHIDRFVLDRLPPAELLPDFRFDRPELAYPARLNAAAELLDRTIAQGRGENVAFYCADGAWRYRDLAAVTNRIAHVLVDDLGFVPGNRVLLRGLNSPVLAAIWLAVLKAGGVVVTSMPMLRAREIAGMIDKAAITLAFCEAPLLGDMTAAQALAPLCGRVVTYSSDPADPDTELAVLAAGKPDAFDPAPTLATDPALIAFTSGTTGGPKATTHFHRDILAIADCFPRSILETRDSDIFLCSAPMAFTFGLGAHIIFPLRYGGASILVPTPNPDRFLDVLLQYRPTIVMTAPTAYRAMTARARTLDLGHVRHFVSAGEHLPIPTFEAWRSATGKSIINGIGATEMLHIFISAVGDDIRPGSIGRAIPGYEAAVFDDAMQPLPPGEIGRLAVRGPTGCRYLDDPRQATYVKQGWNLTGDACLRDADGYIWFQSRADEMIVSSGYNISGREVEEAVLLHPAVNECAVVGVPDEDRGTIVKAFIVPRADASATPELAAEIQNFVKATIAPYKYPRAIEFVPVLPRSDAGKVQRYVLRNAAQKADINSDRGKSS
jgi:2-aminobenzoate-CoA ligase